MNCPEWIAVDWGTTNLRAWGMLNNGTVFRRIESRLGMARVEPEGFEAALTSVVGDWLSVDRQIPVIACGMVGADQGWIHAPYRCAPCTPVAPGGLTTPVVSDHRISVAIVPGISTTRPGPDVMRGEESQIAGLLSILPEFEGVVCLPGTHSKWVSVNSGHITGFQSYMTGELFELLGTKSLLRHSVDKSGWRESAYLEAVERSMRDPARISASLFSVRSESLVCGLEPADANSRLSGILIGTELASTRSLWSDQDLVVLGSGTVHAAYTSAFKGIGKAIETMDSEVAVLNGLSHAYRLSGRV